jgi:hypothetical protein
MSDAQDQDKARLTAAWKFERPNLSNATVESLVDEVALVRRQQSYYKAADGFLGEALKARLDGKKMSKGTYYQMSREEVHQTRVNSAGAQALIDRVRELLEDPDLAGLKLAGVLEPLEAAVDGVFTSLSFEQMRFSKVEATSG